MKWVCVWWIIHVGHMQEVHIQHGFQTQQACEIYGGSIPVKSGIVRWHCSVE